LDAAAASRQLVYGFDARVGGFADRLMDALASRRMQLSGMKRGWKVSPFGSEGATGFAAGSIAKGRSEPQGSTPSPAEDRIASRQTGRQPNTRETELFSSVQRAQGRKDLRPQTF